MTDIAARLDTITESLDRAHVEVAALCRGDHRWTMRVPAQPDRDSDILISDALIHGDLLVAALRAVLDTDLIRREIQAEIEDSTDPRGHINHFDLLPDRCADRIHARIAEALETT